MPSIGTNALETALGKALYDHGMVDLADESPKNQARSSENSPGRMVSP